MVKTEKSSPITLGIIAIAAIIILAVIVLVGPTNSPTGAYNYEHDLCTQAGMEWVEVQLAGDREGPAKTHVVRRINHDTVLKCKMAAWPGKYVRAEDGYDTNNIVYPNVYNRVRGPTATQFGIEDMVSSGYDMKYGSAYGRERYEDHNQPDIWRGN